MSDAIEQRLAALEAELKVLHETRAIEALRYRYWYAIADRNVDALVDCFADDAFLEYGFGIELTGRDKIHEFFTMVLGSEELIKQIPRGDNPSIELLSDTEAKGRWLVDVVTIRKAADASAAKAELGDGTRISVQYFEQYRKTDAGWCISHMKNDYLFFESLDLKAGP